MSSGTRSSHHHASATPLTPRYLIRRELTLRELTATISPIVDTLREKPAVQKAFDEANAEYYKSVDWALDISQGEFQELDINGVPARLIRRDPETQVVVTREKVLEGRWKDLPLRETIWSIVFEVLLESNDNDVILMAPKRHRKFREYLADLRTLQKAGVAEPD
jgi:hypothetical protein